MAEQEANTTSKEYSRSTPYPGLNLTDAIAATEKLRKGYGATTAYSRATVAEALGHQGITGPASKKIAALSHYGLLDRDGTVYRQSDIANRIFNNLTDQEKEEAIIEAFSKPALYQKLINDFNKKALPTALDKLLIRNYNVTESAAKSAARTFTDSATFAGVLTHGILDLSRGQEGEKTSDEESAAEEDAAEEEREQTPPKKSLGALGDLAVEVPGTGIVVGFPAKYAFDLSIGAFAKSIKQLKEDAEALQPEENESKDADSKD